MLTAKSIVFVGGAVFCILVAAYLALRRVRAGPNLPLTTLIAAFLLKGLAFWLSTPRGSELVDTWTGVANLGALGIHLTGGVLSTAALLVAITYWTNPPGQARTRARRWMVALTLVGVAMVALWLVANLGVTARDRHYLMKNAGRPLVAAYLLLYVGGIIGSMSAMARTAWRAARVAAQPWLRRGLFVAAAGALTYVVFGLNRLSALVAAVLGVNPLSWEIVTVVCTSGGILLLGVGLTMPHWGPGLSAPARAAGLRRQLRALYPLWRDLQQRHPGIALNPHRRLQEVLSLRDLTFRRYRRVIEIRDGLLASGSTHTPGDSPDAVVAYLRQEPSSAPGPEPARRTDAPPAGAGKSPGEDQDPGGDGGTDFDRELAWLLEVARRYRQRPRPPRAGRTAPRPRAGPRGHPEPAAPLASPSDPSSG